MVEIKIKPLSINEAWQGKRFKTPKYKKYCQDLTLMLPPIEMPTGKLIVFFEFGLSNMRGDYDNLIKATQDIIADKYNFNDCDIYQAIIRKVKVKKGGEFIKFKFWSKLCDDCWIELNSMECDC